MKSYAARPATRRHRPRSAAMNTRERRADRRTARRITRRQTKVRESRAPLRPDAARRSRASIRYACAPRPAAPRSVSPRPRARAPPAHRFDSPDLRPGLLARAPWRPRQSRQLLFEPARRFVRLGVRSRAGSRPPPLVVNQAYRRRLLDRLAIRFAFPSRRARAGLRYAAVVNCSPRPSPRPSNHSRKITRRAVEILRFSGIVGEIVSTGTRGVPTIRWQN